MICTYVWQGELEHDIHDDSDGSKECEYDRAPRPYRPPSHPDRFPQAHQQIAADTEDEIGTFNSPIDLTQNDPPQSSPVPAAGRRPRSARRPTARGRDF